MGGAADGARLRVGDERRDRRRYRQRQLGGLAGQVGVVTGGPRSLHHADSLGRGLAVRPLGQQAAREQEEARLRRA